MPDATKGLIHKYEVKRTDGKPVGWCFVLEDKDSLAIPALETYAKVAREAGFELLANDLELKIKELKTTHELQESLDSLGE